MKLSLPNATLIFDIELVEILAKAPTPTPTPIGEIVVWGDANCKDGVNPVDSLLTLRHDAHLGGTSTPGCPSLGQAVDVLDASLHIWGDVDCSGEVTPVDSLKILRHDAGLSSSKADPGCPDMGAEVIVTPGPPALGDRAAGLLESSP